MFQAFAAAGTVNQNYASILLLLLRLRQACDHPLLVKEHHSFPATKPSVKMAQQLPREVLIYLLNRLEASLAICGVCSVCTLFLWLVFCEARHPSVH